MSLSQDLEEKKYDLRLVNRKTDKGFAAPQGFEKFIVALEDDSAMATTVYLEDEVSEKN